MGGFQKTVLIIALVILLIVLLIIGGSLMAAKSSSWPPMVPNCPDWWVMDGSGKSSTCVNVKNLGTCSQKSMDFNKPIFTGSNGTCAKYNWATKCKVAWDGITYGVNNPCSS